jgi:hypothetical protein
MGRLDARVQTRDERPRVLVDQHGLAVVAADHLDEPVDAIILGEDLCPTPGSSPRLFGTEEEAAP